MSKQDVDLPENILLARDYIVQARKFKQNGQFHRDVARNPEYIFSRLFSTECAKKDERRAKELRRAVQYLLSEEEKVAGQQYTMWGKTTRGAKLLTGKDFRLWYEYERVFGWTGTEEDKWSKG